MRKILKILTVILMAITILSVTVGCHSDTATPENGEYSTSTFVKIPNVDTDTSAIDGPEATQQLTVYYLPQGCAVLESAGQYVLLDGCSAEDANIVIQQLQGLNVERLNYIVVPNAKESRYSGVKDIMDSIPTGLVVVPRTDVITEGYETFLEDLGTLNTIAVGPGSFFNVGTCSITPIAPIVEQGESPMDTSLILRVVCGETAFLFPSDATSVEANTLLTEQRDIKADIVFANCQGDSTLTHAALRLISPKTMVVAPNSATLPDVSEFGTSLEAISDNAIVAISDGETVTFNS